MLEAAAGVRTQMQNESVIVIRNNAEHSGFSFNDFLDVSLHPFGIVITFAVDNDPMRHAAHREFNLLEIADFKRRVVENVEVFRAKRIWLAGNGRQPSCDLPARWGDHAQSRRGIQASIRIHQKCGIVPERMIRIQFVRAHREFVGVDAIEDLPLPHAVCVDAPRVLINLRPR